jgi:hypothetical protein
MMLRFVQSGWFETLLRPVVRMLRYYAIWAVIFDRIPTSITDANPNIAKAIAELRAKQNERVQAVGTDRDIDRNRAVDQAMTWGVAGVGVIILTAIIAGHISSPSSSSSISLWIATACFSFSVPFLIVLGIICLAQSDPKSSRPTVRQVIGVSSSIWMAQFVFAVRFAAFLWSYSPITTLIFVFGCFRARRYFHKFAVASHPIQAGHPTETALPTEATKPIEMAEIAKPTEAAQPIETAEIAKPIDGTDRGRN